MIIHLTGDLSRTRELVSELKELGGVEIHEMSFEEDESATDLTTGKGAPRILGILVENRDHDSITSVQKTLTSYGCVIRTRLGVNEEFFGEPAGLIVIELTGDE